MREPAWFASQSLSARFAIAGSVVMLCAALGIGWWVTGIISRSVVSNTAGATALFMDSAIGPLAQELEGADTLSIGPIRAIEEVLGGSEFGKRVVSVKIWKRDGLLAYSEKNEQIGQRFPTTPGLDFAFTGHIVAELNDLDKEESVSERDTGLPLLEIYSPIRKAWTGEIIAVVEFYEDATDLEQTLVRAQTQTWIIVAITMMLIGLTLFGIVRRASMLIDQQKLALAARIEEAERASEQNRSLRLRVERASGRVAELNEQFLRRVSADLHDGPAQLISLAALRLGSLASGRTKQSRLAEKEIVRSALDHALRDIRDISTGLTLPEIEAIPLHDMIVNLARTHERYTDTKVELALGDDLPEAGHAIKICVFRFIQEGLNNAFRHANGLRQRVDVSTRGNVLHVTVSNAPSLDVDKDATRARLGLAGLQERVESIGGKFEFLAPPGEDVRVTMEVMV